MPRKTRTMGDKVPYCLSGNGSYAFQTGLLLSSLELFKPGLETTSAQRSLAFNRALSFYQVCRGWFPQCRVVFFFNFILQPLCQKQALSDGPPAGHPDGRTVANMAKATDRLVKRFLSDPSDSSPEARLIGRLLRENVISNDLKCKYSDFFSRAYFHPQTVVALSQDNELALSFGTALDITGGQKIAVNKLEECLRLLVSFTDCCTIRSFSNYFVPELRRWSLSVQFYSSRMIP